ncbi:MAG TPA: acyltransferase [Pseudolabrys sp.]|jgi:peptidoglycan/LPS O-acetylase OafA/YrhL|nr:acyltransferase [Pseudolabrys sp.]
MRSTEGLYFSRLDHVRAAAAYLVFCWHFLHLTPTFPVPYASAPVFPLSLIDEGHTGVALFMTLSGYLFAKLVGDRAIDFPAFLVSRAVRLGPLLAVVITAWVVIGWLSGAPIPLSDITQGFILPTWPKGTWSVSIELQFYLVFPLLLLLLRKHGPFALLAVVAYALAIRFDWWRTFGETEHLAYWTILGRIDQFVFGMLFALTPISPRVRRIIAGVSGAAFLLLWHAFDRQGGYWNHGNAASTDPLWIVIPTIEALTYASFIAWYDNAQFKLPARLDRALAKIGEWSFSIYLLHFFPAVALRNYFWTADGTGNNFYVAWIGANVAFVCFLPVAALSYNYFEKRFLVYRRPYLRAAAPDAVIAPKSY